MLTLIKFYDKDVLKNITATLTLKPERVIFFYDRDIRDRTLFLSLEKCFRRWLPQLIFDTIPIDILNLQEMYDAIGGVVSDGEYALELTGGSELMLVSGYRAARDFGMTVYYTDLARGVMLNLFDPTETIQTARLTLEDFVDARGARFVGKSHVVPSPEGYASILAMCQLIFRNLEAWKQTCSFLQTVAAKAPPHELEIHSQLVVVQKYGKEVTPQRAFMEGFLQHGFLKKLKYTQDHIYFTFTSLASRQYLTTFGIWLELFCYIEAKKTEAFEDVELGMMIDWNGFEGNPVVGNEFDVVICDRSMPVFISCKLRDADTAALNELVVAKKRIGGWFCKGVIVSFGHEKKTKSGAYKRSQELGLVLLDADDILSNEFGPRLVKALGEHDLVSQKWTRV